MICEANGRSEDFVNRLLAHEIGHLWGNGDLYGENGTYRNLDSIYSQSIETGATVTFHDLNAMYIALGQYWYRDANLRVRHWSGPGTFTQNGWVNKNTAYIYNGYRTTAYRVLYKASGVGIKNIPQGQTKVENVSLKLSSQIPSRNSTVKCYNNDGTNNYKGIIRTHIFKNWINKNTKKTYNSGVTYNDNQNMTLEAQWYPITVGELFVPVRKNYIFDGWYTKKEGGTKVTASTTSSDNLSVYAHWIKRITLTQDEKSKCVLNNSNRKAYYMFTPSKSGAYHLELVGSNKNANITLTTDTGYQLATDLDSNGDGASEFDYWLKAGQTYYIDINLQSSVSLTCHMILKSSSSKTYNINFNGMKSGVSGLPSLDKKVSTTRYTLPENELKCSGYVFLGWDTNNSKKEPYYYKEGNRYNYQIEGNKNYTLYAIWGLTGDVNQDGSITLQDAQLAQKIALKIISGTRYQKKVSDYNQDGIVNMTDVKAILNKALAIS